MPTITNKRTGSKRQVTEAELKNIQEHPSFKKSYSVSGAATTSRKTTSTEKPEGKKSEAATSTEKSEGKK